MPLFINEYEYEYEYDYVYEYKKIDSSFYLFL